METRSIFRREPALLAHALLVLCVLAAACTPCFAQDCFGVVLNDTDRVIRIAYGDTWIPLDPGQVTMLRYPCGRSPEYCAYELYDSKIQCHSFDGCKWWWTVSHKEPKRR